MVMCMRRKDREIETRDEIFNILKRCSTVRIGMNCGKYPYVVPVSFGMEELNDKAVIYFHCAQQGMKVDLLKQNPSVCIEGDNFIGTEVMEDGITTRYESVIGFGECRFIADTEEIRHGIRLLVDHYGYVDYPIDRCKGMEHMLMGKIVLDEIYGKKNVAIVPVDEGVSNNSNQQSVRYGGNDGF